MLARVGRKYGSGTTAGVVLGLVLRSLHVIDPREPVRILGIETSFRPDCDARFLPENDSCASASESIPAAHVAGACRHGRRPRFLPGLPLTQG